MDTQIDPDDSPQSEPQSPPRPAAALDVSRWAPSGQGGAGPPDRPWKLSTSLPGINQFFLLGGTLLMSLGFLKAIVPPTATKVSLALHPYTAAGKQETCLSHLRSLALAMSQYAQDYDGRFPPMDYQTAMSGKQKRRVTWVTALGPRVARDSFLCPGKGVAAAQADTVSSYGLNPVLPGIKVGHIRDKYTTILLADRGDAHDVALLPPFPSWPPPAKTGGAANLDFRHQSQADILYVDGHAEARPAGAWAGSMEAWGGGAVLPAASARLATQYPALRQVEAALAKGDTPTARKLLASSRRTLQDATAQAVALWKLNAGTPHDDDLEQLGWRLAGLWRVSGDPSVERALDQEQSQRSQAELAAAQRSPWPSYRSAWGFTTQHPANWNVATEIDGHYQDTYFRSGSSHIYGLVEQGIRSTPATTSTIDWTGMENTFRKRYGSDYRRIRMGKTRLSGQDASLWVFEIQKPGGPRLRKLYAGRADTYKSYVVTGTAPAADFDRWQPLFEQFVRDFRFG